MPVLATIENWVAPFRHAEEGPFPDDALYAPWRLVDVWLLSTTEHTEDTEGGASSPSEPLRLESHAENAEPLFARGADGPATNLCFTAFSYAETNLCFTTAWPTNEALPVSIRSPNGWKRAKRLNRELDRILPLRSSPISLTLQNRMSTSRHRRS